MLGSGGVGVGGRTVQGSQASGATVSPFLKAAARPDPASRNRDEILPKRIALRGAEADLANGRIRAPDGSVTELRAQSARVLAVLAERRGEVVGKEALHAAVWGDIAVTEDSLVQCVGDIRRALGDARDALRTVPKRGYCLEPETAAPAAPPRDRWRTPAAGAAAILALAALLAWSLGGFRPAPPARAAKPVVAVLPFANGSGGARWDRLASGVTDEIIADLGRNDWIAVFARATSERQAGATPEEVRAALGADYVVTGTVQAEGRRVRIAAALADAETGRQVWAQDWQGPPDDLLALQASAATALTGALAGSYTGAIARAGRERAHARTTSLEAYDLFLIGTEHKHRFTETDLNLARDYLRRAVALDPSFAKAWVGLSITAGFLSALAMTPETLAARLAEQRGYIERALAADPDDPAVLIEASRLDDGDPDAAAHKLRRAVARAPNDADNLAVAAWSAPERAPIAREALDWADRALALNPEHPDWYMAAKGQAAFAAGDDAAAIAALREGPKDYLDGWVMVAAAAAALGDPALVAEATGQIRRISPDFDLAVYLGGWPPEPGFAARLRAGASRAGLDRLSPSSPPRSPSPG